jgi:uncharacterized protein DUF3300
MVHSARVVLVAVFAFAVFAAMPGAAQPGPQPASAYSQDELDQLLAPIALYPDQLLTQVLIAATYPLEVVEASRFVRQNPNLSGEALDQAIADKNWDPSVQSLAAFPQVLAMMDDKLEWTQRLGDAFLTDEAGVMDTVQSLRQRAEAAGNLQSSPQQTVMDQYGEITIAPVQPDVVYVPVYDPFYVYGPWWAPAYPPWFWYPPPFYGYPIVITGIVFGRPCSISHHHWHWGRPDWHHRHIVIDGDNNRFWNRPGHPPPPAGGGWQHSPDHRRGVAYPNAATRDRFVHVDPDAVRARQQFRGYDLRTPSVPPPSVRQPHPNVGQPAPTVAPRAPGLAATPGGEPRPRVVPATPNAPPAGAIPQRRIGSAFDPGISRQQAQIHAERGMQSRQSIGPAQAPAARAPAGAAPAPHSGGQR